MNADDARAHRIKQLAQFMEEQETLEAKNQPLATQYPAPATDFARFFDTINYNVFEVLTKMCINHPKLGECLADYIRRPDEGNEKKYRDIE